MSMRSEDEVNQELNEWLYGDSKKELDENSFNSAFAETVHNGGQIDWDFWVELSNITPNQAARLKYHIDPIKWPSEKYNQGRLPDGLQEQILRLMQWLEARSANWSLNELANALGLDNLPFGMAEAVKKQRIDEASRNSFDIEPLEPLSSEQKQGYYSLAAWSWVDAIYILQGYKPVFQLSTEQVRSHFPNQVAFFTQSLELGNIGKEITRDGSKTYIDSPSNWQAFWLNRSAQTKELMAANAKAQGSEDVDWQNDPSLIKLEKQHKAILEVIKLKQFSPMEIPDGEKGTIEMLCRADYPLLFDADSSFSNAWKNARHLFKMANHASFAKRGRQ